MSYPFTPKTRDRFVKLGSLTNQALIKIVFWAHMLVGFTSHVAVFLLVAGAFNLLISNEGLSFWTKGMLFGLLFISGMYGVNHVTNQEGFCFLTDLENFYRKKEGMPLVGRFMPRYYAQMRKMLRIKSK